MRDNYWQQPPSLDMVGVATEDIIDIDEAGFKLTHQNLSYRKTDVALRCDQPGVDGWGKPQYTSCYFGRHRECDEME